MNEILLKLLEQLGIALPEDAAELTEEALLDLINQAISAIGMLKASAQVALDTQEVVDTTQDVDVLASDITDIVDDCSAELAEVEQILEEAALSGLDLSKYVPARAYQLLAKNAAVLSARAQTGSADSLITAARRSGRVVLAEVPYLRTLARTQGVAALSAVINGRPAIAAITSRQTTLLKKPAKGLAVLSATDKEAARLQGLSEAEFLKRKKLGAKK